MDRPRRRDRPKEVKGLVGWIVLARGLGLGGGICLERRIRLGGGIGLGGGICLGERIGPRRGIWGVIGLGGGLEVE
jgi:hypothetical protein